MNRLLTQQEVCELVRISYPTLYRWLKAGTFPTPVNGRGRKLLWAQSQIEEWTNRQSTVTNEVAPPSKTERQKAREFAERQERAHRTLESHGIKRRADA
jgi:excisionase family DNA binding protein